MDFLEGLIYMIWRGIAIGVIISAPMGPVGILCVQRTLEKGRRIGLLTGVGAAISDLFYCLLTGFGLSFIEDFLKENQNVIQIFGSVVLVLFGVYLFRSNPARTLKKPGEERASKGKTVLSGFLFTFSNPLIIFLIIGLFARFNFLLPEISFIHYIVGFISIIVGALFWWWVVTYFIDKVRSHFNLRSMWLINKITGVIIMIFAVVGVVTAITNIANAGTREPVCLNSTRGFGALDGDGVPARGEPLHIASSGPDTVIRFLPLDKAEEFSFSFRYANRHNAAGKSYAYVTPAGATKRASYRPWGLLLKDGSHIVRLTFTTIDDSLDPLAASSLDVTLEQGAEKKKYTVTSGLDLFTGWNSLRLNAAPGQVSLAMGNRRYEPVLSEAVTITPDSVGIWVAPGGVVEFDAMTLTLTPAVKAGSSSKISDITDSSARNAYFARSRDEIEGVWEVFDRMLDDSRLRNGGNYRVAIVDTGGAYEAIYLDGARTMASRWKPGMVKAMLRSTSFKNVFNVDWVGPDGKLLAGEIKAQYASPGVLTLTFADHGGSTLRLRKVKDNAGN